MSFVKVGENDYVNDAHIERVQFKAADDSAIVYLSANSIAVTDEADVSALLALVGAPGPDNPTGQAKAGAGASDPTGAAQPTGSATADPKKAHH